MTKVLFSSLINELVAAARREGKTFIAYLLGMAAVEAAKTGFEVDTGSAQELLVGAWDWDIVTDRVYADARFARMFGISAMDAATGTPLADWIKAIHPDDKQFVEAEINKTLKGSLYAVEYRVISEGKVRWLYARGKCTTDVEGRLVRFPGAIVEITHEKNDGQATVVPTMH